MAIETIIFFSIVGFVILQRIVELFVARSNERWIRGQGGYEVGANHYPYMVGIHIGFFISLIIEFIVFDRIFFSLSYYLFIIFVILQLMRVWVIASLGRFWNTKILVLPGANVVKKGPFRFLRHPNYIVVSLEILVIPLMFGAYFTALLFSLLNLIILTVRIPVEEAALREETNYTEVF